METESDRLASQRREIVRVLPRDSDRSLVASDRSAILAAEGRDDASPRIENLCGQLTFGGLSIDEQAVTGEANWTCGQRADRLICVHRREAVTSKNGQPGAYPRTVEGRSPRATTDVEMQLVTHHKTAAAD